MDNNDFEPMSMSPSGSSVGEAVSERGQNVLYEEEENENEQEDMFYIPERRPSLDLGPTPMDTSNWHFIDQALSPSLSYWSMTSGEDSSSIAEDDGPSTSIQLTRADSYSSCYSLDSDDCEKRIPKTRSKDDSVPELSETPELIPDPNKIRHPSLTVRFTFEAISKTLGKLSEADLKKFKMMLWTRYPQSFNTSPQNMDLVDLVDRLLECYTLEVSLNVTKFLLEQMKQKKPIEFLEALCLRNEVRYELRQTLKRKYSDVCEDFAMQGVKKPLDDVFIKLYLSSLWNTGPNIEHEIMTIEKLDSNREAGTLLSTEDILTTEQIEKTGKMFTLLTGVAGSGKSMAIRRLILDWAEERAHQHIALLLPLPFRELKQFEGTQISFLDIIRQLYPETKKLREEDYNTREHLIMLVFDGLDEYPGNFDFDNSCFLAEPTQTTDLNSIMVNLVRANLLHNTLYLVTARPYGRRLIPWDTRVTEIDVRGFCEPDKDKYFEKRFRDPHQVSRVIEYTKSSKTLRIMCHLPLFCSLVADEWECKFREQGSNAQLPKGITYMYLKLLLALIRQRRSIRAPDSSPETEREFLMNLGKLALHMLEKGKFQVNQYTWEEFGIDEVEAMFRSGLCTEYLVKPHVLFHEKAFSFIHPTMQEFMAALYVFLSFANHGKFVFEQHLKNKVRGVLKGNKTMEMYKGALDRTCQCEDGKLDLFLRFLFGMSAKTNLELLQTFCTSSLKWSTVAESAAALIRKKLTENQYPARSSNLQCCLEEIGL